MIKGLVVLTFSLSLGHYAVASEACGCGGFVGKVCDVMASPKEAIEYVVIEGQELFVDLVKGTISSLVQMYNENPESFDDFINLCIANSENTIPSDLLEWLKKFGVVQNDAKISDIIKMIVAMSIERRSDGSVKIWTLDDLVKEKFVRVSKRRVE
jgi:hypothetical protein